MPDTRITIRGLDPELYQWLRVESVKRKMTIGTLLNELVERERKRAGAVQ